MVNLLGFTRQWLKSTEAKQTMQNVYVVKTLSTPLLGLPAIVFRGLHIPIDNIGMKTLKESYP